MYKYYISKYIFVTFWLEYQLKQANCDKGYCRITGNEVYQQVFFES